MNYFTRHDSTTSPEVKSRGVVETGAGYLFPGYLHYKHENERAAASSSPNSAFVRNDDTRCMG